LGVVSLGIVHVVDDLVARVAAATTAVALVWPFAGDDVL
jgi:hypothetical protein